MWKQLKSIADVDQALEASVAKPQLLFKHSTTCSISATAHARMDRGLDKVAERIDVHYLDLLALRPVSNYIAEKLHIVHESPQALLLLGGECVAEWSHLEISTNAILEQLDKELAARA